ncbi:MAG: NAD(P)H-flavin reductase [Legionellaceae bacterium]|nr:NAD(P)H-flavin reductase [Legionellaceae bacterium]
MSIIETYAEIEKVVPLTNTLLQFFLKPERYIDYQAGQYLQIITNQENYNYSIANAPLGTHRYELHIRHNREHIKNQMMLATMEQSNRILIQLPLGNSSIYRLNPTKPIIFIAVGTGFAPIKAIIEQLFADKDTRRKILLWSVNTQQDLYMNEKASQWQKDCTSFSYVPYLFKSSENSLISVINKQCANLDEYQIVMNGPFDLMYIIRDALLAEGLARENLFSDAFSFES